MPVLSATTPRERDIADFLVSDMIGVAATWIEDRVFAALGLQQSDISFEPCESIEYGGVIFLLPFLLANGLLSYKKYYSERHEAYSPSFFRHLWKSSRIAVITYRKNVKDKWDEEDYSAYDVDAEVVTTMYLCEKEVELNGVKMREVRKLTDTGHQTSVITTNYKKPTALIALYMFSRWVQENFFSYMRQEYDIDRIIQYGIDELDQTIMVVNREYSNISHRVKKLRERKTRRQAKLYVPETENIE